MLKLKCGNCKKIGNIIKEGIYYRCEYCNNLNNINEYIKKVGNKWCVFTHKDNRNMGCYKTKAEAEKRLKQIKRFSKQHVDDYMNEEYLQEKEDRYNNMSLNEWLNFDYQEYLEAILLSIDEDKFIALAATSSLDVQAGMLTTVQINKLKKVLTNSYTQGLSIRDIAKSITSEVKPKDLFATEDGQIKFNKDGKPLLRASALKRATNIARTETTRLASEGSLKHYKNGGIKKAQFVATFGERTCPICENLHGQIFTLQEASGMIPVHNMCFIDAGIPIYTSKGYKKISKIKKGDLVLTHKGKFKKVINILDDMKYDGDVIKISFSYKKKKNGKKGNVKSITVTPEHPIMTKDGWKEAKKITSKDEIVVMAKECKLCNKIYPILGNYEKDKGFCSQTCVNKFTAIEQFKDIKQKNIRSVKTKEQMKREDRKNKWSKEKLIRLTKNARKESIKTIRKMIIEDKHPFQINRWDMLPDDDKKKIEILRKIRDRKGEKNPRHKSKFSNEYWKKDSEKKKEYYRNNPEKHPNRIIAQKLKEGKYSSYVSMSQLKMYDLIKEYYKDAELEYPIKTEKSLRFADVGIPSLNIDIEYDGDYWHKDEKKDKIRDEELNKLGWTTLRFNKYNVGNVLNELNRIEKNHKGEYKFISINPIKIEKYKLNKARKLYNFGVDKDESYIANNIVVHNCRCTWSPITELR